MLLGCFARLCASSNCNRRQSFHPVRPPPQSSTGARHADDCWTAFARYLWTSEASPALVGLADHDVLFHRREQRRRRRRRSRRHAVASRGGDAAASLLLQCCHCHHHACQPCFHPLPPAACVLPVRRLGPPGGPVPFGGVLALPRPWPPHPRLQRVRHRLGAAAWPRASAHHGVLSMRQGWPHASALRREKPATARPGQMPLHRLRQAWSPRLHRVRATPTPRELLELRRRQS